MKKRKITARRMLCVLLSVALLVPGCIPASASTARATTIRLEKTEGKVELKTQNGTERKISEGMRLFNGNTLKTEQKSYAYVSLDDSKAAKLDESSKVSFRQKDKNLELLVKSGQLFFNVEAALKDDESMNIRTGTMVTGIRGTCGVVEVASSEVSKLLLFEGKVAFHEGGKTVSVVGGQIATVQEEEGKEQKITVEAMASEKEIPIFAIEEIVKDSKVQKKIEASTNLSVEKMKEILEESKKNDGLGEENQKEEGEAPPSSSEQAGSQESAEQPAASQGLDGTVTPDRLSLALEKYGEVTIEEGATLNLTDNDTVTIPDGKTLVMKGSIPAYGTISIGKGSTLKNSGSITGSGTIIVGQGGSFQNSGTIEGGGTIKVEGAGTFANTGNVTGYKGIDISGGSSLVNDGAVTGNGTITITGAEARAGKTMALGRREEGLAGGVSSLFNNGTITGTDIKGTGLAEDAQTFVANNGQIRLTGAYSAMGSYETGEDDALLISNKKSSALTDAYLAKADVSENNMVRYYYGNCLNPSVASSFLELSASGSVAVNFQKTAMVKSDVRLQTASDQGHYMQLNLNGNHLEIDAGVLTLVSDISIRGSGSQTILINNGGSLVLGEEGRESLAPSGALLENTADAYVVAPAEAWSTGKIVTIYDRNLSFSTKGDIGKTLKGATMENDKDLATVKLPSYVDVKAEGGLEYREGKLAFVSPKLSGTITAARLKAALAGNSMVVVAGDGEVALAAGETVVIPSGKTLKIENQESEGANGRFHMDQGSQIDMQPGSTLRILGMVTGNGSISAAGSEAGQVMLKVEGDHGKLAAETITLGNSNLVNEGSIEVSRMKSLGNGEITNNGIIEIAESYTSDKAASDTYAGGAESLLTSGEESTALPAGMLLMGAGTVSGSDEAISTYYYADSLNGRVKEAIGGCCEKDLWIFAKKPFSIPAGESMEMENLKLYMGKSALDIEGTLTLEGTPKIYGEGGTNGAVINVKNGGTLNLLGDGGEIKASVDVSGKDTSYVSAYAIGVFEDGATINWQNENLKIYTAMKKPEYTIKPILSLSGSDVVVSNDGFTTPPLRWKDFYTFSWDSQTGELSLTNDLTILTGRVTVEQLNATLQQYKKATIAKGAALELELGETISIIDDAVLTVEGTIKGKTNKITLNGGRLYNQGTIEIGSLDCSGANAGSSRGSIRNNGTILLSGAEISDLNGVYIGEENGVLVVLGTGSWIQGFLEAPLATAQEYSGTVHEYSIYASNLNQNMAQWLSEKSAKVHGSGAGDSFVIFIQRDLEVRSDVRLENRNDKSVMRINLSVNKVHLKENGTLTLASGVYINGMGTDIIFLDGGRLVLGVQGSQSSMITTLENFADGYVIGVADNISGSTEDSVTLYTNNISFKAKDIEHTIKTISSQGDVVTLPDYVQNATGLDLQFSGGELTFKNRD